MRKRGGRNLLREGGRINDCKGGRMASGKVKRRGDEEQIRGEDEE